MREFKIRKVISVLLVFSIVFSLFSSLPTFVSDVYASSGQEDLVAYMTNTTAYVEGKGKIVCGVYDYVADAKFSYKWYKGTTGEENFNQWEEFVPDDRFTLVESDDGCAFYIDNVQKEDFAWYKCIVTDQYDNVSECEGYLFEEKQRDYAMYMFSTHSLNTKVFGKVDAYGNLKGDTVTFTTKLTTILPKNEYKFIWAREVHEQDLSANEPQFSGFLNMLDENMIVSDVSDYVNSDNSTVTIRPDKEFRFDVYYPYTYVCYAVKKDDYYAHKDIAKALQDIKSGVVDSLNELRDAEMKVISELADTYTHNPGSTPGNADYYLNYVTTRYPLGLKYVDYKECFNLCRDYTNHYDRYLVNKRLYDDFEFEGPVVDKEDTEYIWYILSERDTIEEVNRVEAKQLGVNSFWTSGYGCQVVDKTSPYYNFDILYDRGIDFVTFSDLSVRGYYKGSGEKKVGVDVTTSSNRNITYTWYKVDNNGKTILEDNTDEIIVEEYSDDVYYICTVNDGYDEKDVKIYINSLCRRFNPLSDDDIYNSVYTTDADMYMEGEVGSKKTLGLSRNVTQVGVDTVYRWYKNGELVEGSEYYMKGEFEENQVNTYELEISTFIDGEEIFKNSIRYTLRPTWENDCIKIEDVAVEKDYLDMVKGLKVTSTGLDKVCLSWTPVECREIIHCEVYIKENGKYRLLGQTDKNTYTVTGLSGGKNYEFAVKQKDLSYYAYGLLYAKDSAYISTRTLRKPTNVTNFKIESRGMNNIKVNWSKVSQAIGYALYIKKNGSWSKVTSTTATSYNFTKLAAGTRYEFAIKAYDKIGTGEVYSDTYKTLTTYTKPSATTGFKVTSRGTNGIATAWNKVSGAHGYRLFIKKNGSWTRVTDTTKTSYTYSSLASGTRYELAVKPYVKNGSEIILADSYATISIVTKPGKVSAFKTTATSTSTVSTSWKKVTGATGYRVYVKKSGKFVKVADTSKTSYKFTKLSTAKKYTFAVRAYRKEGTIVIWADFYPSLTAYTKPATVSGLKGYAKTKSSISVKWSKKSGVTGYRVQVKKNGKWSTVTTTKNNKTTKCTIKKLKRNTTYQVRVQTYKTISGKKVYSDWKNVKYKTKK